jgi:hypothetical protein
MHIVGTFLMWTAWAVGILVGGNLSLFIKRWIEEGQVWHVALIVLLLHGLLFIMLWTLDGLGMRCRAIHCQASRGLTFQIANR